MEINVPTASANEPTVGQKKFGLGSLTWLAWWVLSIILGGPVFYILTGIAPLYIMSILRIPVFDFRPPASGVWFFAVLGAIGGAVAGLLVGLCQWLILRSVSWAGKWIVATVVGWIVGGAI